MTLKVIQGQLLLVIFDRPHFRCNYVYILYRFRYIISYLQKKY